MNWVSRYRILDLILRPFMLILLAGRVVLHFNKSDMSGTEDVFNDINDGHYLELMDRIYVVMSNIETHIQNHPLMKTDSELETNIQSAMDSLGDAYQRVGAMETNKDFLI